MVGSWKAHSPTFLLSGHADTDLILMASSRSLRNLPRSAIIDVREELLHVGVAALRSVGRHLSIHSLGSLYPLH